MSTLGLTPYQSALTTAVKANAPTKQVAAAMLVGSALESGQSPANVAGVSYGPYQIEPLPGSPLWAKAGQTVAGADNPETATKAMLASYEQGVAWVQANNPKLWQTNVAAAAEAAALEAENPAGYAQEASTIVATGQPVAYGAEQSASNVGSAYQLAMSELTGKVGPYQVAGGSPASTTGTAAVTTGAVTTSASGSLGGLGGLFQSLDRLLNPGAPGLATSVLSLGTADLGHIIQMWAIRLVVALPGVIALLLAAAAGLLGSGIGKQAAKAVEFIPAGKAMAKVVKA